MIIEEERAMRGPARQRPREETPMTPRDIFRLYEYTAWANARMLDAAEGLTADQFTRDLRNSFPSVRDTLAHIVGAEWVWLRRWHGESPSKGLPAADFPTVASLRERCAVVERERRPFLETLSEEGLSRPVSYRDFAGHDRTLPLVVTLQHVVNHGTYHRGQVTTLLRQLGATPVSTDLSRFFLEQGPGG
jgi:uncharacterized damage-inducible protein DinB